MHPLSMITEQEIMTLHQTNHGTIAFVNELQFSVYFVSHNEDASGPK